MRRPLPIRVWVLLSLLLLGILGGWLFLSAWIPTHGKAMLVREFERRTPLTLSIGAMRFGPLRGVVLEQVRLSRAATQERFADIPHAQLSLNWLALAVQHRAIFRGRAAVETPCRTMLTFSGNCHLRDHSFSLELQTTDTPLRSITPPLARYVPRALVDGTLRLRLDAKQRADQPLRLSGRLDTADVIWQDPAWRFSGHAVVNGSAVAPAQPGQPWSFDARSQVRQGTLEGLPGIGTIDHVRGTLRLRPEQITIEQLTGTVLGSPWALEGDLALGRVPSFEVLASAHAALAPLIAAVPQLSNDWQPSGTADVRAVCRGLIQPILVPDCLVQGEFHHVTLKGAKLVEPLSDLSGRIAYDLVMRQLSIDQLEARVRDQHLAAHGGIGFVGRDTFSLTVSGGLPLNTLIPWLPAHNPVSELDGLAALALTIRGDQSAPQITGRVDLERAHVRFGAIPLRIDELTGPLLLDRNRIDIRQASLRLNDQPLSVSATASSLPLPRIIATVECSEGELWITSQLTERDLRIDEGRLSLKHSDLQFRGRVGRRAEEPSTIKLTGTVELGELTHLPFLRLPQLEAWKLEGPIALEAQADGVGFDLQQLTLTSRLRGDQLRVKGIPVEQLVCQVERTPSAMRLRVPGALIAEGRFQGEFALERRDTGETFLFEGDLTGLQLARLSQLIPAWKNRSVVGSASSHATLLGTWNARSTWRGEGWLNATGERMGEIPLLQSLFHGLFGVLADRLGLEMLRREDITQASLHWKLAEERLHTDDLRLGGLAGSEPIAIYGTGSVGLDGTLDLVIDPELSEATLLQAPTPSSLAGVVLKVAGKLEILRRLVGRHRLTGTIKEPHYRFEVGRQELLNEVDPNNRAGLLQDILKSLR